MGCTFSPQCLGQLSILQWIVKWQYVATVGNSVDDSLQAN